MLSGLSNPELGGCWPGLPTCPLPARPGLPLVFRETFKDRVECLWKNQTPIYHLLHPGSGGANTKDQTLPGHMGENKPPSKNTSSDTSAQLQVRGQPCPGTFPSWENQHGAHLQLCD